VGDGWTDWHMKLELMIDLGAVLLRNLPCTLYYCMGHGHLRAFRRLDMWKAG
jgi:hypothetical protein